MNYRDLFEIDESLIYLNSGTLAKTPRSVRAALRRYQDQYEANPAQSLFDTWGNLWAVQKDLAKFFNANPLDLFLRPNVTYAMNDFLMSVELPKNSEILVTDLEYGAITNICQMRVQRDGLSLRTIHLPSAAEEIRKLTEDELTEIVCSQLSDKTSMLMISHVTTGTGLTTPIKKIAARTRELGIILAIDGAHGAGAIPLDFSQLEDVDFYGSNLHKWMMGPKGTGFGWVNPRIKNKLTPSWGGWTSFEIPLPFKAFGEGDRWVTQWMITSTNEFAPFYALRDTLAFWREHGSEALAKTKTHLSNRLLQVMEEKTGWPAMSAFTPALRGPLFTFALPQKLEAMGLELMNLLRKE